ncbi:MAG: serine protease [Methylobacter sp.]|nr:MAG: serine protease [Methylobacter sp.]PPD21643.1 MAG: serine protease [Methylobacter sp.]
MREIKGKSGIIFSLVMLLIKAPYAAEVLPSTIDKIKPSIVAVGTYMAKRNPRAIMLGTGFVVGDGKTVITNEHVVPKTLDVEHLEQIAIFFRYGEDNKIILAKHLVSDADHDLAVLSLTEGQLPALKLGKASTVKEGGLYAFTGYPIGMVLGLYPVTHRGIVSAISPVVIPSLHSGQLNSAMLKRLGNPYDVFQLDATAYPGSSGSPLYDIDSGEVVGVINKVFVQETKENLLTKPSGITYAIPVNHLDKLLKDRGLN